MGRCARVESHAVRTSRDQRRIVSVKEPLLGCGALLLAHAPMVGAHAGRAEGGGELAYDTFRLFACQL